MRYLAVVLSLFTTAAFGQNFNADLKFGSFYETNTYYSNDDKKNDIGFLMEPHLAYSSGGRYSISTDSTVSYTKYLSNTNQDNFTYDLNLKNNLKVSNAFQVYATPKVKLLSEPALDKTQDRLERQFIGANFGMIFAKDPRRQYIFETQYEQESLNQAEYDHLNNQAITAKFYYKKYFLPETFVYFGVSGGTRQYPDGLTAPDFRLKYDNQRIEPGFGLEGRLTRYFKIRSYFGYSLIKYKAKGNYQDPVYVLELEEELSPKDFLLLGLENTAEDSYFTNFQLNQKVYVGYGRFIGDQILWVSKVEYIYRTFSKPQRRDDQRFVADSRLEYSYSEKLKLEASVMLDVLSSDAVDPDTTPIDPSSSYQNIRAGFYGKYLF